VEFSDRFDVLARAFSWGWSDLIGAEKSIFDLKNFLEDRTFGIG
jgi:hypothetical protein